MQTITLEYNPANSFAKALIQLIRASHDVHIVDETPQYNDETLQAFRDIEEGRTTRVSSVEELFDKIFE